MCCCYSLVIKWMQNVAEAELLHNILSRWLPCMLDNQTFIYIGSLAWNYISGKITTDVSYICFKDIAKLHILLNTLPQIRLTV